jgi:REP element-mobilizing transposase RayT
MNRHGGRREGAGRKAVPGSGVSHHRRPAHSRHNPVHVTLKVRQELGNLRSPRRYAAIESALAQACQRFGFRLVHFSVQRDHIHLIVEAVDRRALRRGMQGLSIRVARALNKALARRGKVFSDRYHAKPLTSPRQVRNSLRYVLNNFRRHRMVTGAVPRDLTDECSSAPWFDGWKPRLRFDTSGVSPPVTHPTSWLLAKGWRRRGLIRPDEVPAG